MKVGKNQVYVFQILLFVNLSDERIVLFTERKFPVRIIATYKYNFLQ